MTTHVTPQRPGGDAVVLGADPDVGTDVASRATSGRVVGVASVAAWAGFAALVASAAFVFWGFEALPFQDLPAHAGLIAMRHRYATSPFEQQFYVLAPHIGPYSLFRLLGELFHRALGAIGAVRALGTLPVLATPLAFLFARRRLFADSAPTYGFVGLALSFGLMTLLGFASYLLGVAMMIVGLTLWLDLLVHVDERTRASGRKELLIGAFAPAMFVAHGHSFVLFLLCAFTSVLASGNRPARLLRLRALAPAVALAGWVAWIERGAETPAGSVPVVPPLVPMFHGTADKLGLLVTPTLMTRTGIDFFVAIGLWAFTITCTILSVRSLRATHETSRALSHSRALYACAAAVTLVFLALPHAVGWFGFVDGRLVPVVLALALLGIRRVSLPRPFALGLDLGAPVVASTITALALVATYRFQDEARGFQEVLGRVPAESRLLNLPLDPNSDVFTAHPFVHYDKLVLADRPIVVSDVWFHQGSALYPTPQNPALRLPASYSESDLKGIDWPSYRLQDWDYVLIRTRPVAGEPHTPDELELDAHQGGWWLFRTRRR